MLPKTLQRTFYKALISLCVVSRNLTLVVGILIRDRIAKVNLFLERIQSVHTVLVFEVHLLKREKLNFHFLLLATMVSIAGNKIYSN